MDTEVFASIIIDIASDNTDRLFSYKVPFFLLNKLAPGFRVLVPFGFQEREGIVISLTDSSDIPREKIKDIIALLDDYPAITSEMISLALKLKDELHCTLCESLRLMIPSQMRKGRIHIKYETFLKLSDTAHETIDSLFQRHKKAPNRLLILQALSDMEEHPLSDLKKLIRSVDGPLSVLIDEGSVISFQKESFRRPGFENFKSEKDFILTEEQKEAYEEISNAMAVGKNSIFLLHGVTGSGKTEVYVHLARKALALHKKAVILVPEISLTPQMVEYFYSRFGSRLAVIHSRLSAGERFDEWRRIRFGEADIVIGARSAVFSPIDNLGILIIDEEQEGTYLSETRPQYDARSVAIHRGAWNHCPVVLSSATPSIYSYAMARNGNYTLLEMKHRANNLPLPEITLVDMREELKNGNHSIFSGKMKNELLKCFAQGEQAILFVNRRGYAPFISCRSCGSAIKCSQCDVSLTYHKADSMLHCHYCGNRVPLPSRCPSCGSKYIRPCGIGTQKVEEEFQKEFPGIRFIRMDQDTTTKKGAHEAILNTFRSRQAQVLIGTQMIAKGHDFPAVTFVGALLADLTLNLPDYRSAERTYQLLVQVAGRAGRRNLPGTVVIQSYKPEHYAISSAVAQDYRAFFNEEFERRRMNLYPPFTNMSRLLILGKNEEEVLNAAKKADAEINAVLQSNAQLRRLTVFHMADMAPIQKIQNIYRAQVLLKTIDNPKASELHMTLQSLSERISMNQQFRADYDINPPSLA